MTGFAILRRALREVAAVRTRAIGRSCWPTNAVRLARRREKRQG